MMNPLRSPLTYGGLNPVEVAAYLRSTGWTETEHQPDRLSVWQSVFPEGTLEVLLPLRRSLADYFQRMAETVRTIAAKEERQTQEVLRDLQLAGTDVIRIRFRHALAEDGSIPLHQGEALVSNAREMMLAGACAAVQPRAYYSRRRPDEVNRFLSGLRLGGKRHRSWWKICSLQCRLE